ncbi:DUF3551 domain-containing protein [Nitrobacter sp.]|uniref:DUF3551 domain-containing protein n=1 Tax=Nitrobacter sp. TaxID=29420 RepID=UPI003F6540D1
MRAALLIATAIMCSCGTAHAQAWDSRYPVCMVVYGPVISYNDCGYTTFAQCRRLASGLPAQCQENPFFASPKGDSNRRRHRRHNR